MSVPNGADGFKASPSMPAWREPSGPQTFVGEYSQVPVASIFSFIGPLMYSQASVHRASGLATILSVFSFSGNQVGSVISASIKVWLVGRRFGLILPLNSVVER